jgi:hypothetical protein
VGSAAREEAIVAVGRARGVLKALAGIGILIGFIPGVRGHTAALLETEFLPHLQALLPTAGVPHAEETTGRAAGELAYVHTTCTTAAQGRRLIWRVTRYEDTILRFTADLTVPFTNYADIRIMPSEPRPAVIFPVQEGGRG